MVDDPADLPYIANLFDIGTKYSNVLVLDKQIKYLKSIGP
jgi:hypothetical protein